MATEQLTTAEHCQKEAEITKLQEQVKTLYKDRDRHEQILNNLNNNVLSLRDEITKLNTTLSSFKWTTGIGISLFGGISLFLVIELIKLIH